MRTPADSLHQGIQTFIVAVGFPESIEQVRSWIDLQRRVSEPPATLIEEILVAADENRIIGWSVPRWAMEGDISVFYQTARSYRIAKRLSDQLASGQVSTDLVTREYVEYARSVFHDYAGNIFAIGRVKNRARFEPRRTDQYWGDLHYADVGDVFLLHSPMALKDFRSFITIRRQATITPLGTSQFQRLRDCIIAKNIVPAWFRDAVVVAFDGRPLDSKRWREYLSDQSVRFLHEAQLRDYFANGFLSEIADSPSDVLAECVCWRRGKKTGRVDYVIRFGGKYVPVETKIQVVQSPDLDRQMRRYYRIDRFAAYEGKDADR